MSLNYTVKGHGEPIVLLHGLFGSLENLGVIARQLEDEFQVISIDLPDHGRSAWSGNFAYSEYATAVVNTLTQLGINQFNLLGHSMGGKVAMHMALNMPTKISRLVVADIAPVSYPPRHQNVIRALQAVASKDIKSRSQADNIMSEFLEDLGVRQFLLKSLFKTDKHYQWRFNLALLKRDYELLSAGIDTDKVYPGRTLFVKGGNSDYITMAHQDTIKALFPNAEAKIMSGTGHWLHAEKPFVFAGIVTRFLKGSD